MTLAACTLGATPREHTVKLSSRFAILTWKDQGEWDSLIGTVKVRSLPVPGASPSGKIVKLVVGVDGHSENHFFRKDEFWGSPFYVQWCALSRTELIAYLFEDVPSLGWKAFGSFVRIRVVNSTLVTEMVEGEAAPSWYSVAEQGCHAQSAQ